jgi:hypothetical protein
MLAQRRLDETKRPMDYKCGGHHQGRTTCQVPGYVANHAHAGILDQLRRLKGTPWNTDMLDGLLSHKDAVDPRVDLQRALDAANEKMKRHIEKFVEWEDPTPQEIAAHRAIGRDLSARIAGLEAELAALPAETVSHFDLKALHDQVTRTDVGTLIDQLQANGDEVGLRDLALLLVESAIVVERLPAAKAKWVRASVTWTQPVQTLLDAGLLTLGPDVEPPYYPRTAREQQHERYLRWRERKKAGLLGKAPPARTGIVQPD